MLSLPTVSTLIYLDILSLFPAKSFYKRQLQMHYIFIVVDHEDALHLYKRNLLRRTQRLWVVFWKETVARDAYKL